MSRLPASYAGSISEGTLNRDHLFPRFLDVLRIARPDQAATFADQYAEAGKGDEGSEGETDLLRDELLNELCDALDQVAPEGTTFGHLEGDGSDFGFWPDPS